MGPTVQNLGPGKKQWQLVRRVSLCEGTLKVDVKGSQRESPVFVRPLPKLTWGTHLASQVRCVSTWASVSGGLGALEPNFGLILALRKGSKNLSNTKSLFFRNLRVKGNHASESIHGRSDHRHPSTPTPYSKYPLSVRVFYRRIQVVSARYSTDTFPSIYIYIYPQKRLFLLI